MFLAGREALMRTKLILTCLVAAFCANAGAQTRDIGLQVGLNMPLSQKNLIGSDLMLGVSYGQFNARGFGFRTGFQYAASTAEINDVIGIPVAFAYRTHSKSAGERFEAGAAGAADAMMLRPYGSDGDMARFLGGFLLNLFSDMEFFAGVTPGYVAGLSQEPTWEGRRPSVATGPSPWPYQEYSWVEKICSFSLTVDAGLSLNYSIWRFDLKLIPAFHYNLTNNYLQHHTSISLENGVEVTRIQTIPLRWFFTLNGGLAFRF